MSSPLTFVFDEVVDRFEAEAAAMVPPVEAVEQAFGWREPEKNTGLTHRITWVPGDDSSGDAGAVIEARQVNRDPRPLATFAALATIYVHAQDVADPENEALQHDAAWALYEQWHRHVYGVARGAYTIRATRWVTDKKVRRAGATLRVLLAIEGVLRDVPSTIAPMPVTAEIEVELLDHTETVTAPVSP